MLRPYLKKIQKLLVELNLFEKDSIDIDTTNRGRLATRIYILTLVVLLLLISWFAAFVVRTIENIVPTPSFSVFEHLLQQYSNTLNCPCDKWAVSYEKFVTVNVQYHQVCSSQFIEQMWIESIYIHQNMTLTHSNDFRAFLSAFWQIIASFCLVSKQSLADTIAAFHQENFLTPVAVAKSYLIAQAQSAFSIWLDTTQTHLISMIHATQNIMSGNQLISGLGTNMYFQRPTLSNSITLAYTYTRDFKNCSCLYVDGCPSSVSAVDQFNEIIPIPGLIIDCSITRATLRSTFECYYNQTCLSLIHGYRANSVQVLSASKNQHFRIDTVIEIIVNNLMIDSFTLDVSFDSYYNQCNPSHCYYKYNSRFQVFFIITVVLGIYGILSTILRILIPLVVSKLMSRPSIQTPVVPHHTLRMRLDYLKTIPSMVWKALTTFNLFRGRSPPIDENLQIERITTRLFVLVLLISCIGLNFYVLFSTTTQIKTTANPSISTYRNLYRYHNETLICPCSKLSIPYEKLINISYSLHEICSSDLISQIWINYLLSADQTSFNYVLLAMALADIRIIGVSYFQIISTFCSMSKSIIDDAYETFLVTKYINDRVIPSHKYDEDMMYIMQSFINLTVNDFLQMKSLIELLIDTDQFLIGINTNQFVSFTPDGALAIIDQYYLNGLYINGLDVNFTGICICSSGYSQCELIPLIVIDWNVPTNGLSYFPGLSIRCRPSHSLYRSKIDWWYNRTALNKILDTYRYAIPVNIRAPSINALNSTSSRYSRTSETLELVNRMFVETWDTKSSIFDSFYEMCAPISCSYTIVEKRDMIVAFLLIISVLSGLNEVLRLIVPLVIVIILFFKRTWRDLIIESGRLLNIRQGKILIQKLFEINLFQSTDESQAAIRQQRWSTRLFLTLFFTFLAIFLFYSSIVVHVRTMTHSKPSVSDFERLLLRYPTTLRCPCVQKSIQYDEFVVELRVKAYHPICTSVFVSSRWIDYLIPDYPSSSYVSAEDFRFWGAQFFTSIKDLCSTAQDSLANSLSEFQSRRLIMDQMISRDEFEQQITSILDNFLSSIAVMFRRNVEIFRLIAHGDAFLNRFSFNWKLFISDTYNTNGTYYSSPVVYQNPDTYQNCSCATSRTCFREAYLYDYDYYWNLIPFHRVSGLYTTCSVTDTIFRSSLICLFSSVCVNSLIHAISNHSEASYYYWPMPSQLFEPLDETLLLRFTKNDSLSTIINGMFVESWITNISYENLFNACSIDECTFSYYYHFDLLDTFRNFLSIYKGLMIALQFLSPLIVQSCVRLGNRLHGSTNRVSVLPNNFGQSPPLEPN